MEKEVVAALVGAAGGLVAGVVGAIATLRAKGIDQLVEDRKLWVTAYDTTLLKERLLEYRKLWKLTEKTSRRYVGQLDFQEADTLAKSLTDWYYSDGGIVLSGDARARFFQARDTLEGQRANLGSGWHAKVIEQFSALRTALCEDLNSRRGPTLRESDAKDIEQNADEGTVVIRL
jgi:hypothetical protein